MSIEGGKEAIGLKPRNIEKERKNPENERKRVRESDQDREIEVERERKKKERYLGKKETISSKEKK